MNSEVRQFTKQLINFEKRLKLVETGSRTTQLGYSSIEDDYVAAYDALGQARQRIGRQSDGTFAVTYANGDPPPVPTVPAVVAHQLALVIGWDGTFVDGVERPADLARVDVHVSETSGFLPDGSTLVGSLAAEGAVSFPADSVTHYVRLVAVTTSDVISAPTLEIGVLPLPAGRIAVGAIGAQQLAAEIVLTSLIRMYSGNMLTLELDGTTGDALITGEIRSADSGERMVFNPAASGTPAVRFYPDVNNERYAELRARTSAVGTNRYGAVEMQGPADLDDSATGHALCTPVATYLWHGPHSGGATLATSQINIFRLLNDLSSAVNVLAADRSKPPAGTNPTYRNVLAHRDSSGNEMLTATLTHFADVNNVATLGNFANDIGLVFQAGRLFVVNSDNTEVHAPLTASSITQSSGRASKHKIEDVPFSALATVRGAPSKMWERPPKKAKRRRNADEPQPTHPDLEPAPPNVESLVDWSAMPTEKFFGPMAEDLPEQLRHYAPNAPDAPMVDLGSMIGVLWKAVEELSARVDALTPNPPKGTP